MALLPTGTTYSDVDSYREFAPAIKLVKGDVGGELSITLRDSNTGVEGDPDPEDSTTWTPLDLTGSTVVLKIREEGSSVVKTTVPMYKIQPEDSGQLFLQWTEEALDTAGTFTGEVEITYTTGQILTVYKELRFQVREDY